VFRYIWIRDGIPALTGGNGGGKSTLIRLLTGIQLPQRGALLLDGLPVQPRERQQRAK